MFHHVNGSRCFINAVLQLGSRPNKIPMKDSNVIESLKQINFQKKSSVISIQNSPRPSSCLMKLIPITIFKKNLFNDIYMMWLFSPPSEIKTIEKLEIILAGNCLPKNKPFSIHRTIGQHWHNSSVCTVSHKVPPPHNHYTSN